MATKRVDKKMRIQLYLMALAGCIALAGMWIVMATPKTAMAKPPSKETIYFDVNVTGDMLLVGTFIRNDDGTFYVQPGLAEGRAETLSQVVVNRPSPAIQMDFLAALSCFTAGDIYGLDGSGTLVIIEGNKGQSVRYSFRAYGKDGTLVSYRIDADADIVGDTGGSFPRGDTGYTVTVSNIQVSQDTGKKGNACEGSFPEATATIRLDLVL